MDFYLPERASYFLVGYTKWWWLPNDKGGKTLVVSVLKSDADGWVVAYTILVGLIFTAACYLATAIVLTTFRLGNSGTRQAILVSYYNGGGPSGTILPMLGYVQNALWRCRRRGQPAIDWESFRASFGLLVLAVFLLSADVTTKFYLGGKALIVANIAQANPDAVFYPAFSATTQSDGTLRVPLSVIDAIKTLVPEAVYQANSRKTNAKQRLSQRVNFQYNRILDGTPLLDGSRQNGTGAQFTYEYSLTGFEMGLRDAPKLQYKVKGACATYHGSDGINSSSYTFPGPGGPTEEQDVYPLPGAAKDWSVSVYLSRENYTAPWAFFFIGDAATQEQEIKYGMYTFMIVPHIAWRQSVQPSSKPDPWYETEPSPVYAKNRTFNPPHRVKRARPALRCTQSDTYTHYGITVNHVTKLSNLPGLKLSPFIRDIVFGREFGVPVFSKLLGNLPFGTLASTAYFDPNVRQLDVTRVSLEDDMRGLLETMFVYSREVVRNTVLLYSSLKGQNDPAFSNAADIGNPAKNADFFLEGTDVAAMSVFVMLLTPSICVFVWFLLFAWKNIFIPGFHLDNKSTKARHRIRNHAYRAVTLLRFLDEEVSRARKYSGRDTDTPFIRDLDAPGDDIDINAFPVSAPGPQSPAAHTYAPPPPEGAEKLLAANTGILYSSEAVPTHRTSQVPKPKVLAVHVPYELPHVHWFEKLLNRWIRGVPPATEPPEGWHQVEVAISRVWDPEIEPTRWENVRRHI